MPNKSSKHGGFITEGTVSHGTLRTQDLLHSFADELDRVLPFNGRELSYEARHVADACDAVSHSADPDTTFDDAQEILTELMDQLDSIAQREGMYFGAHEGDGSDFGYWKAEENEED